MNTPTAVQSHEVLLRGAIDYAGLFPPASLSMTDAVRGYLEYRGSADRWALGRLIVPAARLSELAQVVEGGADQAAEIRISATLGGDAVAELALLPSFNERGQGRALHVDAWEAKVGSVGQVEALAHATPDGLAGYGEVGFDAAASLLDRLKDAGLGAKIRMGGVTVDLFPAPLTVALLLTALVERRLPFKATAGLHHPVRGEYRLTYEPGSATGTMFGYLNVMIATMAAQSGADPTTVAQALSESEPGAIRLDDAALWWRDRSFAGAALEGLRTQFHGFGSCSFREPVDELRPLVRS